MRAVFRTLVFLVPPRRDAIEAMRVVFFLEQLRERNQVQKLQADLTREINRRKREELVSLRLQAAIGKQPPMVQREIGAELKRMEDEEQRFQREKRRLEPTPMDLMTAQLMMGPHVNPPMLSIDREITVRLFAEPPQSNNSGPITASGKGLLAFPGESPAPKLQTFQSLWKTQDKTIQVGEPGETRSITMFRK